MSLRVTALGRARRNRGRPGSGSWGGARRPPRRSAALRALLASPTRRAPCEPQPGPPRSGPRPPRSPPCRWVAVSFARMHQGGIPVARVALQLGEVVPQVHEVALHSVCDRIGQQLVERLAGLVQGIGVLEQLPQDEARADHVGDEDIRQVPLQGEPLDPASPDRPAWPMRNSTKGYARGPPPSLVDPAAARPGAAPSEHALPTPPGLPEQPGIPEVLLDPCPRARSSPHLVERGSEVLQRGSPSLVVCHDPSPRRAGPWLEPARAPKAPPPARERAAPTRCLQTRDEPCPPRGSGAGGPHLCLAAWLGAPSPRALPPTAGLRGIRPAGRRSRAHRRRRCRGPRPTGPGGALVPLDR